MGYFSEGFAVGFNAVQGAKQRKRDETFRNKELAQQKEGQQTNQALAVLGIMQNNRENLAEVSANHDQVLMQLPTLQNQVLVAQQAAALAEKSGSDFEKQQAMNNYEAVKGVYGAAQARLGNLSQQMDSIRTTNSQLSDFASRISILQDIGVARDAVQNLQQPQQAPIMPPQSGGDGSFRLKSQDEYRRSGSPWERPPQDSYAGMKYGGQKGPQGGAAPDQSQAQQGTAPTESAEASSSTASGSSDRMESILGIAKKLGPDAVIDPSGASVSITAESPSDAQRITKQIGETAEAKAGLDLPINVRTRQEMEQQQNKQGTNALAQSSSQLQKVGIETVTDEGGIHFVSQAQDPQTGQATMGRAGIYQDAPAEDVARAIEGIAMQARTNPQIALAAQRDLGPVLESYAAKLANDGDLKVLAREGQRPRFRVNLFSQNNVAARKFGEAVLDLSNGGQSQNMPIFELPSAGQAVEQFMEHARKSDEFLTEDKSASPIVSMLSGKKTEGVGQRGAMDAQKLVDYVAHFEGDGGRLSEEDSRAVLAALKTGGGFGLYRWAEALQDLATIAHPKYAGQIRQMIRTRG